MNEPTKQLLRGTLHVLILKTLSAGALHGYGISTRIAERSDGALGLEDGALYQALHRMEERGWLASEWGTSNRGKRARFYQLTDAGRAQLEIETASWIRYADAVSKVLQPAGA